MSSYALALEFPGVSSREVICTFDGGEITSDAGMLMVSAADKRIGLLSALADEMTDNRQSCKVTHGLVDMLRERVFAIAMGYEDANDLDHLRDDPALKVACRKRPMLSDVLASQPTISRLENSVGITEMLRMGLRMACAVVSQLPDDTSEVVLDIDATDDECHGHQQLRLFDGHYKTVCYVPLYMHITDETGCQRLLGTLLRSATARSNKGVISFVKLAVRAVRQRFPNARIILRGDCGFGYGRLMNWCDANSVDYVLGFQATSTLKPQLLPIQMESARRHRIFGEGHREYEQFSYKGESWTNYRRVVAKAEAGKGIVDTRCVVTSDTTTPMEDVYKWYTKRGDQENRIKEMKLDLTSGRTSCHRFLANQFRLLLHTAAGVLMGVLQAALTGTKWAKAQVGTLRLRLLKVSARVVETCRRIWLHLPTSFPDKGTWKQMHRNLVFH